MNVVDYKEITFFLSKDVILGMAIITGVFAKMNSAKGVNVQNPN